MLKLPNFRAQCGQNKLNKSLSVFVDKAHMKDLVRAWAPELRVAKMLAIVQHPDNITMELLDTLPESYVFKATHSSGMIMGVMGRKGSCLKGPCAKKVDGGSLRDWLKTSCGMWVKRDYSKTHGELEYTNVPRRCMFEELLDMKNIAGELKIFVFGGVPVPYVHQISGKRHTWFSSSRVELRSTCPGERFKQECAGPPTPKLLVGLDVLELALEMAGRFAARVGIPFIRVDFMVSHLGTLVFGELSFTSQACHGEPAVPKNLGYILWWDRALGPCWQKF